MEVPLYVSLPIYINSMGKKWHSSILMMSKKDMLTLKLIGGRKAVEK